MRIKVKCEQGNLRVRSNYTTTAPVIDRLLNECMYELSDNLVYTNYGEKTEWLKVRGEKGVEGYCMKSFVEILPDIPVNDPMKEWIMGLTREDVEAVLEFCKKTLGGE